MSYLSCKYCYFFKFIMPQLDLIIAKEIVNWFLLLFLFIYTSTLLFFAPCLSFILKTRFLLLSEASLNLKVIFAKIYVWNLKYKSIITFITKGNSCYSLITIDSIILSALYVEHKKKLRPKLNRQIFTYTQLKSILSLIEVNSRNLL